MKVSDDLCEYASLTCKTINPVYFYALDALPLFLATVIYAPFWPGEYVTSIPREEMLSLQKLSNPYNVPHREVHYSATEDS